MTLHKTKKQLKKYLQQQEGVVFAYLFGSALKHNRYRDIDVGIYMRDGIDLLDLGGMQTELNDKFEDSVDLIPINNLPVKKPVLAFNIAVKGELLFTTDVDLQVEYKKKAMLQYYDTAPLREMMNEAFDERLQAGKFGERDFSLEDH